MIISREEETDFHTKLGISWEVAVSPESDGSEEMKVLEKAEKPSMFQLLLPKYKSAEDLQSKLESFLSSQ